MKTIRLLLLSQPVVVVCLLVGLVLATGTAIISTLSARDIASSGAQVSSTSTTLLDINRVHSALTEVESAQRNYLSTGLDSHLAAYNQASARLEAHLSRLGMTARGADAGAMSALRSLLNEREQKELAALALSSSSVNQRAGFFQRLLVGISIGAYLLGGAGAVLFVRRIQAVETLITVCAWTKRVKFNDSWMSFEDYLRERFNFQFTHGICEEAAEKLRQEVVELTEADAFKFAGRSDSTPPMADITMHPASARAA